VGVFWGSVGIKAVSIFANSYVLNMYGILEGLISNMPSCSGNALNHYALDNCNSFPLSVAPVYKQVMKTHRKLDSVLLKAVSYWGIIFRLGDEQTQFIYNSILAFAIAPLSKSNRYLQGLQFGADGEYLQKIAAAMSSSSGGAFETVAGMVGGFVHASFASIYGMFFLYDEIFLKYLQSLIQNENYKSQNDLVVGMFALSNLVFDSIANGKMKTTLLAPQYRVCQTYTQLTGNTQSALGKVVFHGCLSIFEVFYATLQIVSSTVTLSAVTDCICNINDIELEQPGVLEERCRFKLPDTLYPQLAVFIRTRDPGGKGISVCSTLVNNFKNVLIKIPNKAKTHIDIVLRESVNIPVELMSFLNIKGLQADSCTQYSSTLDVITIVPRPISAFKKCAYIPSCRCVVAVNGVCAIVSLCCAPSPALHRGPGCAGGLPVSTGRPRHGTPLAATHGACSERLCRSACTDLLRAHTQVQVPAGD
jgi:hypothetical protein